jgi:hypothetical protein
MRCPTSVYRNICGSLLLFTALIGLYHDLRHKALSKYDNAPDVPHFLITAATGIWVTSGVFPAWSIIVSALLIAASILTRPMLIHSTDFHVSTTPQELVYYLRLLSPYAFLLSALALPTWSRDETVDHSIIWQIVVPCCVFGALTIFIIMCVR